ncbi:MAG: 4Fe-4S binding protein, partial [Candidatus Hodarchaeales archaeon]
MAQKKPSLFPEYCKLCRKCERVCQENAIEIKTDYGPEFNDDCVYCGQCIVVCPFGTLHDEQKGYQVLIGGKLGRHPQLAIKYNDFQDDSQVLAVIELATNFVME